MSVVDTNPFSVLTFIAAPAILTNAASVLALGTSNRFARNVDRARLLLKLIEGKDIKADPEAALHLHLLSTTEHRTALLVRAMSAFYFAIGCFALGSLSSLLGAVLSPTLHPDLLTVILIVAALSGVGGLTALFYGGSVLVRETRLALAAIREEADFHRRRFHAMLE